MSRESQQKRQQKGLLCFDCRLCFESLPSVYRHAALTDPDESVPDDFTYVFALAENAFTGKSIDDKTVDHTEWNGQKNFHQEALNLGKVISEGAKWPRSERHKQFTMTFDSELEHIEPQEDYAGQLKRVHERMLRSPFYDYLPLTHQCKRTMQSFGHVTQAYKPFWELGGILGQLLRISAFGGWSTELGEIGPLSFTLRRLITSFPDDLRRLLSAAVAVTPDGNLDRAAVLVAVKLTREALRTGSIPWLAKEINTEVQCINKRELKKLHLDMARKYIFSRPDFVMAAEVARYLKKSRSSISRDKDIRSLIEDHNRKYAAPGDPRDLKGNSSDNSDVSGGAADLRHLNSYSSDNSDEGGDDDDEIAPDENTRP